MFSPAAARRCGGAFAVLLLVLLALLPPSARAQNLHPGTEQGLYELRAGGLQPVAVLVLLDADGRVLLPLRDVLEATGTPFTLSVPAGLAAVAGPRGRGSAVLELAGRLTVDERATALAPGELVLWRGEVYLAAPRLAELLQASVEVDPAGLVVALARTPPFPAEERQAIRARREATVQARRPAADAPAEVPFHPRSGAGVAEWGLSGSWAAAPGQVGGYLRLGLGVYGGMLRLGVQGAGTGSGAEATGAYHRVFPSGGAVRQVQLGDFVGEALRARSLRGFAVTNAPFTRGLRFGEVLFSPQLPAGWEYELYQDGHLLGYSDGSTRAPVTVPLRYGSTPVQLRMYGPAGEQVETPLLYVIPVGQLRAGEFQYAAGGGVCPAGECTAASYLDARYGVSSALTVRGGVEHESDSASTRVRPYLGLSLVPARTWTATLQALAGSFATASVQSFGTGPFGVALSGGVNRTTATDSTPAGMRAYADATLRFRRRPDAVLARFVDVSARLEGRGNGLPERRRAGVTTAVGRVLLEGALEQTVAPDSRLTLLRATAPVRLPGLAATPTFSAGTGFGGEGLEHVEGSAFLQTGRAALQGSAQWRKGSTGPSFSLGATLRHGAGRVQTRVGSQAGRSFATVGSEGAMAFGPGPGLGTVPWGGLGLAGVEGRVFYDRDGDGAFSAGDEPVAAADVRVGATRVRTRAQGRFDTWTVLPYEPVEVQVDTTTLPDPSWVPARAALWVRPAPHLYTTLDFPLVPTREMAGVVIADEGVRTAAGVAVEIRRVGDAEPVRALTFSDGEFYLGRVRPGEYEVSVAPAALQALGARAEPEVQRVIVSAEGTARIVHVLPIVLRPARR